MTHTEDELIEQPEINLFTDIGWQTLDCYSEAFGKEGTLGRDNRSEVILARKLRKASNKRKPACIENEINPAIEKTARARSVLSAKLT